MSNNIIKILHQLEFSTCTTMLKTKIRNLVFQPNYKKIRSYKDMLSVEIILFSIAVRFFFRNHFSTKLENEILKQGFITRLKIKIVE